MQLVSAPGCIASWPPWALIALHTSCLSLMPIYLCLRRLRPKKDYPNVPDYKKRAGAGVPPQGKAIRRPMACLWCRRRVRRHFYRHRAFRQPCFKMPA